jgi:hypothetical protein
MPLDVAVRGTGTVSIPDAHEVNSYSRFLGFQAGWDDEAVKSVLKVLSSAISGPCFVPAESES